jgi:hypothetical protein
VLRSTSVFDMAANFFDALDVRCESARALLGLS